MKTRTQRKLIKIEWIFGGLAVAGLIVSFVLREYNEKVGEVGLVIAWVGIICGFGIRVYRKIRFKE